MTKAQHTPGPWMVEPINGGDTFQITSAESRHFEVIAETPLGMSRQEANAHLIAAAPDLLQELENAYALFRQLAVHLEGNDMPGQAGNCTIRAKSILAAIAKAKGE